MQEWITLDDLRCGALFETEDGVQAVKSEYHYSNENPQPQCVLLASGEYAHFPDKERTLVREISIPDLLAAQRERDAALCEQEAKDATRVFSEWQDGAYACAACIRAQSEIA